MSKVEGLENEPLTLMFSEKIDYYEYLLHGFMSKITVNRSLMEYSVDVFNEVGHQIVFGSKEHFMSLREIISSVKTTIQDYKHNPEEYD